jgi:hypothetical protein
MSKSFLSYYYKFPKTEYAGVVLTLFNKSIYIPACYIDLKFIIFELCGGRVPRPIKQNT